MNTQRLVCNLVHFAQLLCIFTVYTMIGFTSARSLPNNEHTEISPEDSESSFEVQGSTTPTDIDSLIERLVSLPPTVSYTITNPIRRHDRFRTSVPLKPDMTVLHGLVSAVRSSSNSVSPFNVQLMWDLSLGCYVIRKALGVSSDESYHWTIRVRDWKKQVVYKGRCMPRESVYLGPFYKVNIQYQNAHSSRVLNILSAIMRYHDINKVTVRNRYDTDFRKIIGFDGGEGKNGKVAIRFV